MIDKVIIAEDHETANLSVQKTVEEMRIGNIDYAFYCDDALNKIQVAKQKGQPYDLLISDLYFEADGTSQKIADGFELISTARAIQPELLILIFSAEKRPATIDKLFRNYEIDAYVRKARQDAKELKAALEALSKGRRYYPQTLARLIKQSNTYEFSDFDINIIRLLSQGYQQNEIPDYLKRNNIKPSSLSSIEKRLNQIREELGFSKNEQLVLFCKETGVL
jgi:two-component system capsular synthesis response regulator RcsB